MTLNGQPWESNAEAGSARYVPDEISRWYPEHDKRTVFASLTKKASLEPNSYSNDYESCHISSYFPTRGESERERKAHNQDKTD